MKQIKVSKVLDPRRLIRNKKIYDIRVREDFIIRNYVIELIDNKIYSVFIDARHPNSNPENNEFCIPEIVMSASFGNGVKNLLEYFLTTYNLDNAYFLPEEGVEFWKLDLFLSE